MNAYNQLEFEKIIELLIAECQSAPGKKIALHTAPMHDVEQIRYRLNLTAEIQELLSNNQRFDFSEISDIKKLLQEIKNDVFNFEEFKLIHNNIKLTNLIVRTFQELEDSPLLQQMLEKLFELPELEKEFDRVFTSDGDVKDTASPELGRIRRRTKQLRKNLVEELNKKANQLAEKNLAFDNIVTQRDGRFVIPVKEASTGHVPGIVHGRSSSGNSVYLEPAEAVKTNNDLDLLRAEEKEEIFRIFRKYTLLITDDKQVILDNLKVMNQLDFYFAAARMANRYKAEKPVIIKQPVLNLIEARHPLLIESFGKIDKVIPFTVELGKDYKLLLISGPNTGGKTVTLKTVGLLTMMALSGLPIPARPESKIGIFDNFYADIGDFQSLENSLSTFSSHISNIKKMLKEATDHSLVVIDEIGAATDPEQGSALAQAILENLVKKNVTGIITTHYTSLKLFAEQSEQCINAAMQFDPHKHSPTYQFKLGLPGNSFAIEVASKLGMDYRLIKRAKDLAGNQNVELTELLKKISEQKNELAHHNYQSKLKSTLLSKKITEYEKKIEAIKTEEKSIKKRSLREAKNFLVTLQKELNQEISTIKKKKKEKKDTQLEGTLDKIVKINRELQQEEEELVPLELDPVTKVEISQKVWVKDFDDAGEVLDVKGDQVKVQINDIQYTTSLDKLYKLDQELDVTEEVRSTVKLPEKEFHFELKLLGYRYDEARPEIEDLIDNALVNGLRMVRIVHGKGTGALRKKIRQYLRGNKKVKEFFTPPNQAGGDGVTVVMLKE